MSGNDTVLFDRLETGTNIDLYHFETDQFKTLAIKLFVEGSLGKEVEEQSILPSILLRGSKDHPSLAALSRALESLYGARLSLDTTKLGTRQVFMAVLDMVDEKLIPPGEKIVGAAAAVFNDVLRRPLVHGDGFVPDLFEGEKRNLERTIRSLIDNKASYANFRLVEEMFRGDPYGNHHLGKAERVAVLDPVKTYSFYRRFFSSAPMDVYVMGAIGREEAKRLFEALVGGIERIAVSPPPPDDGKPTPDDGGTIVEEQPLEQSKLVMGFHVDRECEDELYYALFLYNAILGGGSFSKLFKTVREKESLAYYASSYYDKLKGFLRVAAGVNRDSFDRVTAIVGEQMADIAAGRISDEEFDGARKSLLSGLKAVKDSPGQLIDYHHVARLAGRGKRIDRLAAAVEAVRRDHVAAAAGLVTPGKIFFLKGVAD